MQAFRLNVSYDRKYYDTDYVQKQIFGVRDSVNNGYMYWNNSGDYGMILPDISDTEPYKGSTPEADSAFKKPAIGTAKAPEYKDDGVSVLDAMYDYGRIKNEDSVFIFSPFLQVPTGAR